VVLLPAPNSTAEASLANCDKSGQGKTYSGESKLKTFFLHFEVEVARRESHTLRWNLVCKSNSAVFLTDASYDCVS